MRLEPTTRPLTAHGSAASGEEPRAVDQLLMTVYDELRRLAHVRLRRIPAQTLTATALVHEAYLRLVGKEERGSDAWANRAHFFYAAARAMRDILVERARRQAGRARANGVHAEDTPAPLEHEASFGDGAELLRLDAALERLQAMDDRKYAVVLLRHFAGLSFDQVAEVLGVHERTVRRDWRYVRAWLAKEMTAPQR